MIGLSDKIIMHLACISCSIIDLFYLVRNYSMLGYMLFKTFFEQVQMHCWMGLPVVLVH
jgi:hypothetical protein